MLGVSKKEYVIVTMYPNGFTNFSLAIELIGARS